ncbi:DUF6470 family protein [Papillibacter cinnamivorans]|uniref:Uncharacterized protein n=1 Tax=Papillibacter cinnamivorans DSM 12816 TaxID=1122930 RepID=A0A1W1YHB8_9FIRM|nr:DUF6470 family protein [Papillibacter cinnamivorans]SMC35565.1 hypothetical protein SAMN02745168_0416 [Papillibacter cinnamivorans DSM 12816]
MKITKLEIEQQSALISVDVQNARLHVESPQRRMKIENNPPEMSVTRQDPEVLLDLSSLKENTGLKTYDQLISDAAAKAKTEALVAVRDTVNESRFIADTAAGGNRIGRTAKDEMLSPSDPDMGHSPVPPGAVEMDGDPGTLDIQWSGYDFSIDWEGELSPEIYVEPPYSVEVEIAREPSIRISVSELDIPNPAGRKIDAEV